MTVFVRRRLDEWGRRPRAPSDCGQPNARRTKAPPTFRTIAAVFFLCVHLLYAASDGEVDIATGPSHIIRDSVNFGLYVPKTAERPHGPLAMLVFFGGYGDAVDYYQKQLASLADDLDIVVVVPQMPWFREKGEVSAIGVIATLDGLKQELETRFGVDPGLAIVGGGSAGGSSACQLTRRWKTSVPLLVLHSSNRCSAIGRTRSVLLVGENEVSFLGEEASGGKRLGEGLTDLFAVPKEQHEIHFRHMRWWLETELSALRLERADATLRLAGERKADATAILRSTKESASRLSTAIPDDDDFLRYQNDRRKELREKWRAIIAKLGGL